ncbi:MAG: hypothetical protein Kow0099_26790 [Candidatus Abyssubacteria bacterium]
MALARDVAEAVEREKAYKEGRPTAALLFLTYRCTSRCRTCKMWQRQWNTGPELSLEGWRRACDSLVGAGVRAVELFGGDVLLRKDVLFPLIRHLKDIGAIVHMPTNCNLLDEETARALVESGIDYLYLSTDGVESLQDEVRGVDNSFGKVSRAIDGLTKCRNGRNSPRFICNTTVSKYNVEVLERIADFASGAGFDEIHFEYVGEMDPADVRASAIDGLEPTPYYVSDGESAFITREQAPLLREDLCRIKRKHRGSHFGVLGINIECLSDLDLTEGRVPFGKCYTERCEVTVDPCGNVVACPFFHSYRFGNLLEQEFTEIWWGERHRRFHDHLERNGLAMCTHCILSVQRNHSFLTRLKRIYRVRSDALKEKLTTLVSDGN